MTAQHIKADGTETTVSPACGKVFSLKELQGYVGGYIQQVSTVGGQTMWINEEGFLDDLACNSKASALLHPKWLNVDGIRGDVLVINKKGK